MICRFLPVEFGVMQLLCWPTAQPLVNCLFKFNPGEGIDMRVGIATDHGEKNWLLTFGPWAIGL